MSLPVIGFGSDAGIQIDLPALLERRLLIQAASGAGKSTLVRALAEQLVGHVQQWVIDREGDFVTLRGVGDFVLVGRGGDVPADRKSVKLLARRLMELGASAVFDLSELRMHEQREYVKLLFEELTHMPRSLWHPLMVWLDEGHFFAPQAEKCVSTQAVADGASVWRKRGYCLAVATQRLSKLDKDVAAELHNKFIGFTDDVDLRRAGDQLGMTTEQRAELQQLDPGVFYAYGPAISRTRVKVRGPKPKTQPPAKGEARAITSTPPEKVRAILAKLVDLAKEADEEARTMEDLRRNVAERDRKIRQLEKGGVVQTVTKPVVDQAAIERAVGSALAGERKRVRFEAGRVRAELGRIAGDFADALALLDAAIARVDVELIEKTTPQTPTMASTVAPREAKAPAVSVRRESGPVTAAPNRVRADGIKAGQQKILNALAELEAIGVPAPSRAQLGMMAGYNLTGGTGAQHIADLVQSGLAYLPGAGVVQLTDAGRDVADAAAVPTTLREVHARVLAKLSAGQRKIAEYLIEIYPDQISRADLGQAVGYNLTGGTGAQHVADLVTACVAKMPAPGKVIASDLLFPESLS